MATRWCSPRHSFACALPAGSSRSNTSSVHQVSHVGVPASSTSPEPPPLFFLIFLAPPSPLSNSRSLDPGRARRAGPGRVAPSRVRAAPSGVRAACGAAASRYSERADMDLKSCIGVSKTIWKGKKNPKNKTGRRNPSPRRVRQRTPSVGGCRAAAGRGQSRGAGRAAEVELVFRRIAPAPGGPSCSRRSSPQFPGR